MWKLAMTNSTSDLDEIEELQDPDFVTDDHNETPPSDIVVFNELRSCADLHRMHDAGDLDIKPDFQRDFVWQPADQTRFIDSLVKQLPIPSLCLAFDYKTDKWIVIDGLQRMSTINRFLSGDDWRLSKLDDIDQALAGKSAATIKNDKGSLRIFYTRVQNRTLPINVLRCDFSKKAHMEYLFTIFHRLNSGGAKLNNQEIRNCIYGGKFNELLKALDTNPNWRRINRMKDDQSYRFVKQEMILRFFAFNDRLPKYKGQIAKFLNDYMFDFREPSEDWIEKKRQMFVAVTEELGSKVFHEEPDTRIPTSVLEASLVGVAMNLELIQSQSEAKVAEKFDLLRRSAEFTGEEVAEGLSKKDKVANRFAKANEIFSDAT